MDLIAIGEKFVNWTKKKIRHHVDEVETEKYFREKEIWWAALGKNIGFEIDGKNELFHRPVLVFKKYSKDMCFVLPLTTKRKEPILWYQYPVRVEGKDGAVIINQGRTLSSKRLLSKSGTLDSENYNKILTKFIEQFRIK